MEPRDEKLWELARKRAGFRQHLAMYVIMCSFFWGVWFFTGLRNPHTYQYMPWPGWVMLSWGVALSFSYTRAYVTNSDEVEKEYNKLKKNNQ